MNLYQAWAKKNECYITGLESPRRNPEGIVVHSTGANNPMLKRYVDLPGVVGVNPNRNTWNTFRPDGYRQVCASAFIGKLEDGTIATVETLPHDMACWLCGSYNPTETEIKQGIKGGSYNFDPRYLQFEICEDNLQNVEYYADVMIEAISYCAYICRLYDIPVENVVSHAESYKQKKGSNHGDPDHWMARYKQNMDWFRSAIKAELEESGENKLEVVEPSETQKYYRVQTGAFSSLTNAQLELRRVKEIGKTNNFNAFISYY